MIFSTAQEKKKILLDATKIDSDVWQPSFEERQAVQPSVAELVSKRKAERLAEVQKARDEQKKASLDPELKSLDESSTGKEFFDALPEAQPDEIPGEIAALPETPSAPEEPEAPSQPEEETPVPDASKFVIEGGLKTGEGELNETTESEEAYSLALN